MGRDQNDLIGTLASLAGFLFDGATLQTGVELVSRLARDALPASAGGGVILFRGHRPLAAAYTDETARQAGELQHQIDEGPLVSAYRENRSSTIENIADETRWPRWRASVMELDIRSSIALPLSAGDGAIGAIKVYAREASSYDGSDCEALSFVARHAAVMLMNLQGYIEARTTADQLQDALLSRDVIGQAKGILMATAGLSDDEAFARLRTESQNKNVKLREVARQIVESQSSQN